jgi:hypothetical protein
MRRGRGEILTARLTINLKVGLQFNPLPQPVCYFDASGQRSSIRPRMNAAWLIAFSTAANLAGLGLTSMTLFNISPGAILAVPSSAENASR